MQGGMTPEKAVDAGFRADQGRSSPNTPCRPSRRSRGHAPPWRAARHWTRPPRSAAPVARRLRARRIGPLWALAFVLPYVAVFLLFVVYPVGYGLWLGSDPASYRALFADPIYLETVINTLLFLAIGVNVKLFLALLLSGFFMRPERWVKALLLVFILPWAVPAIPTFISVHWMLNGAMGADQQHHLGPVPDRRAALARQRAARDGRRSSSPISGNGCRSGRVIFLAGRMAIPKELYESGGRGRRERVRRGSSTSPSRSWPTSTSSARCSRPIWTLGRLQHGAFRLRRRAGAADACAGDARHPRRVRAGRSAHGHGGGDLRAAAADPAGDRADAQAAPSGEVQL